VDRLINRYTNNGELVYDPFAGLMTVPYRAILLGRRGGGSELSEEYFRDGVRYLAMAESNIAAPTLFDAEEMESAAHGA
jgi:DNA modification methylase